MAMHELTAAALKSDPNRKFFCDHCDRKLNPKSMTWLEMSISGFYVKTTEELPANMESQGCFPFGVACAKSILRKQKTA